ncbi:kinesin-like protein KLP2 isoform X1 [Gracilaria domingensis]|nr:kinesin-like protein KLP2 isoform X1 [Gracilaria domingensis]
MHAKPTRSRKRARASTRRKTVRWSTREVDALLAGVRTYGVGKWARILRHSPVFNGVRTSVDLKDKWRNLTSPVRAAALAGEKAPAADPPSTPSVEQSHPLDTNSCASTPLLAVDSPVDDAESAEQPASPPLSTQSPTPTVSLSEMPSVTPELLTSPPFAPPSYNQITPYTLTHNLYHSAAALAADYWRRVSQEAVYSMAPYSSVFPYVKPAQLPHSDDDDDDDEDEDAVQQPLYNHYSLAMAHMFNRVNRTNLGHALTPRPQAAPVSTEPSATETESYPEDECLLPASNQPQNADPKVSSSAMTLNIAFTSESPQALAEDADDTTVEPTPYDMEERKTSTSGDSDQSMLPNDPLFVPIQSLTTTLNAIQ